VTLQGLDAPVIIDFDRFGIPTIKAQSRLDAMRGLGYVSARDRLFQMDLLRRAAAGRLTEIFGKGVLKIDTNQRVIGCNRVAPQIVPRLPPDQREVLEAYNEGVNAFISQAQSRPFECRLLKYQPEEWNSESSVLALLQMFQNLSAEEEGKRRTLITMQQTLPEEVTEFLTPEDGPYSTLLGWGSQSHQPVRPLPVAELAKLMREEGEPTTKIVKTEGMTAASNCWAIDKSKSENGKAIVSNDMHTGLSVPNLWYRVRLCYEDVDLCGVIIPGIPMVLAGSNKRVAWGLTNMLGACLDLIPLEIDPEQPDHYLTPDGPRPFEVIKEAIKRKRGDFVDTEVKTTIWGPVLEKPLLGKPVAQRWTALDPESVNFGLMHMDRATTVEEAVRVVNRFYGPPLNVVMADERGRIGYTVCSRFPARDYEAMLNWSDAGKAWTQYIPPDDLPSLVESSAGFLVNANNLSVGSEYPYLLGHGFPHSYRAYRIAERLRDMSGATEADMCKLQADTVCEIYEFYSHLALDALTDQGDPELNIVRRAIQAWDGKAGVDSQGLVFLTYFRENLAQSIFTPIVKSCAKADENFVYAWPNLDTPLRMILTERPPELLPEGHASWDEFIVAKLNAGVQQLKEETKVKSLENLSWGKLNKAEIFHPLAQQDRSFAGRILNMPDDPLPGCVFSVCASEPGYGASIRMVVAPGMESAGAMHITCGQSGHPLSQHYDDQNEYWASQQPLPFLPGPASHTLTLSPSA
jgi:penicillin amidase